MPRLVVILGDQLSPAISSLRNLQPDDVILMAEVGSEAHYVQHHSHKLILIFSAMRHFAATLEQLQHQVIYLSYQQQPQVESMTDAVAFALQQNPHLSSIMITECGEYRLEQEIARWPEQFSLPLEQLEDDRFICSRPQFAQWAKDRQQFRMEYFYREMRRFTRLLMTENNQPEGGKWNFDKANRKSCPPGLQQTPPLQFEPDDITSDVIKLIEQEFASNMGTPASFSFAVTGKHARQAFLHFIEHQLAKFGDYQDAMLMDQPYLFHSICSMYLNIGLLDARWMCQKVEQAYHEGTVPLNAAEGFIRQIIGWREFVRGLYWLQMPDYKTRNTLTADRALPAFYWTGDTQMRCMQQALQSTIDHAYSHHIHRLMITGNFALLTGLDPAEVTDWYLAVYADAFEWVELPNTLGMALFADDGVLASKPYAASGKYIQRMSNYCQNCPYDVKKTHGEKACPFNALYWDFLDRHATQLGGNARLQLAYRQWHNKAADEQDAIRQHAQQTLLRLEQL
ncbi:cryptochrome/photolyase family protein [Alkalimonas collagenimarina]|uniref:Cryptochrome/photolyase family protein n=1 Tax=Alkalimonas collagenimarina TaxID=400390 RepID=A0ABT9H0J5_9GAMM|nr:cryptochrome/photolyase family protein [Alkalimonas collagenimarina]MDP4536842.1 cryptochrome/photolyase family protein [Alkalimonas collagenimarina]